MRALIDKIGNWLPQGYGDAGRQLSLFVVAELCYEAVRGVADGQRATAIANGQHVIDFEKGTHTFFEPNLQSLFIDHRWIIDFANFMYMNSHFVVTTAFLVWLYLFRNQNFYFVRNMFMVAMGLAVVGYALLPTAPPRLFDELLVDTITSYAQVNHDSGLVKLFINPYAAIPSMHVAFSTMIGVTGVTDLEAHDHARSSGAPIRSSSSGSSSSPRTTSGLTAPSACWSPRCRPSPRRRSWPASGRPSGPGGQRRLERARRAPPLRRAGAGRGCPRRRLSDHPAGQRGPRRPGVPLGPVRERGPRHLGQLLVRRPSPARLRRPPADPAASIGPRLVGVLAAIAAALLFSAIAYGRFGERARLGVIWFATATAISLFTGRLTFALGVAIALCAVLAAQRGHRLAGDRVRGARRPSRARSPRSSWPAAWSPTRSRSAAGRGSSSPSSPSASALLISHAFPEGGTEPFDFSSFEPAILVAIAVFVALPPEERLLRYGVAVYGAALAGAFLIQSPMGGNATRMGSLLLGPILAFGLWRRQRFALILLVPVLIYWQWSPVVRDLEEVNAQPSVSAGYYAPLIDFLRGQPHRDSQRVEVLPEEHHWESAYVPKGIYIARGWERQLDRKLNPLFYQSAPITGPQYRSWLDDLGVGYVAVPRAPLDYAALGEKRLIKKGPPSYLKKVFHSKNWTVYAVADPVAARDRREDGEADAAGLRGRRERAGDGCSSACTGRRTGRSSRARAASSRPRAATR